MDKFRPNFSELKVRNRPICECWSCGGAYEEHINCSGCRRLWDKDKSHQLVHSYGNSPVTQIQLCPHCNEKVVGIWTKIHRIIQREDDKRHWYLFKNRNRRFTRQVYKECHEEAEFIASRCKSRGDFGTKINELVEQKNLADFAGPMNQDKRHRLEIIIKHLREKRDEQKKVMEVSVRK